MAAVLHSSGDSLLVNDATSDGKFVPLFCGNVLSLSSGCWNYIKLVTEVIREEEVGLTVLVGCKNMANYQNYEKEGGSCFGPT
jgi:hypothetical protein